MLCQPSGSLNYEFLNCDEKRCLPFFVWLIDCIATFDKPLNLTDVPSVS